MIFQRKKARPVNIGEFVEIKDDIRKAYINSDDYALSESPILYTKSMNYSSIPTKPLKKYKNVSPYEAELLYVKSGSIFGKDLVSVVPLKFPLDSEYRLLNKILDTGLEFLVPKNELSLASATKLNINCPPEYRSRKIVNGQRITYSDNVKRLLEQKHNIIVTSWENK